MERSRIFEFVGVALFAVGAILAAIGTTSMGLFVFYGVLAVAGIGVATYGRKLRDQR